MNLLLALLLSLPVSADEIMIEAEDAELFGVEVVTAREGYSGTGYVAGFDADGDSLRFVFESTGAVLELRLGVYVAGRGAQITLWIDGEESRQTLPGTGTDFSERQILKDWIPAGSHTVVMQGNMEVDYLKIAPVEPELPPATPPEGLTDSLASPATLALHRFLLDVYGAYILAGQHTTSDLAYIENVTGEVPAVGAFDLIEYSPSRVECGANPGRSAENWIDWADRDGIVNLLWHWNAPTDLIDDDCSASPSEVSNTQAWWSGFYTSATTFDLAAVMEDSTSERYQLLLRDIDAIAAQLRKFEDADVPVLWRPLHEAAGGWFWWGAAGAQPFVALWQLMYDRIVEHHGIHNLIWVYTHEPDAFTWYPGDAYVDVVSIDVYANSHDVTMESNWDQLQETYGARKLIALSESGTLPNPEVITTYGIWWSWFALWSGDFIRDVDPDYLRQVFRSERVMTRDELPDWRALYTASEPERGAPRPDLALALYPNPTTGSTTLRADLPETADVRIEVFDVAGRRVSVRDLGRRAPGMLAHQIDAPEAAGAYLVRIEVGSHTAHRVLLVHP